MLLLAWNGIRGKYLKLKLEFVGIESNRIESNPKSNQNNSKQITRQGGEGIRFFISKHLRGIILFFVFVLLYNLEFGFIHSPLFYFLPEFNKDSLLPS